MNVQNTPTEKSISKGSKLYEALFYLAAAFMPSILLFGLYNSNHAENQIVFIHVVALSGVLAVVGLLLFWLLKTATRSKESSLLICLLFWLAFWMFEVLYGFARSYGALLSSYRFMILIGLGLVFVAWMFRRYEPPFEKIRPAIGILLLSIVAMFSFNLLPNISREIALANARADLADLDKGEAPFYIKRSFVVDSSLPSPDIYWFHMDGMISIGTLERFFGESGEWLREELRCRGFEIYEDAELRVAGTTPALHALMSPMFYDSFFGEWLAEIHNTVLRDERNAHIRAGLNRVGLTHTDIQRYNELLTALMVRGYNINLVNNSLQSRLGHVAGYGYVPTRWHVFGDLPQMISMTTPLNLPNNMDRVGLTTDSQESSDYRYEFLANFNVYMIMRTHPSNWWRYDPSLTERDLTKLHIYPLAWDSAARRMLQRIDTILEENYYAVIVLQADHGLNMVITQQFLLDQGYPLEQVLELSHSVFNAVRIPQAYGGLDAPLAPLNISRKLVNRFVGQNYNLLP